MCIYDSVLGSGGALLAQLLTAAAIIGSALFWLWLYFRNWVDPKPYALPIALWFLSGTLDIVITARGVADGHGEGNPLAAAVFSFAGAAGPAVASILWMGLWAGTVLVINKAKFPRAQFLSLAIFYSLAAGHLLGFSSWFLPLCGIGHAAGALAPGGLPKLMAIVMAGSALAAAHLAAARAS